MSSTDPGRWPPTPWPRWLMLLLVVTGSLLLVLLILWVVVVVPPRLIDTHGITDPAKRLDAENALRTTLAAVLGGLAVIAGAVVGALTFRETTRQNRAVLELQRRGQVTERFTKAIDQLGQSAPDKLDVRLGAIYALEQIARDSEDLHWPVMEVLTAFIREHAKPDPRVQPGGEHAEPDQKVEAIPASLVFSPGRHGIEAADIQAALTVIGRRDSRRDRGGHLDLRLADLHSAFFWRGDLRGADLSGANLRGGAYLVEANLQGANLWMADLRGAFLRRANLQGTRLVSADLRAANLADANFQGAELVLADLRGADLRGADLRAALLHKANLQGARDLTWPQLSEAEGVNEAKLPAYLSEAPAADPPGAAPGAPESG